MTEKNKIKDGGPAFPTQNESQIGPNSYHFQGMSLREYAAIKLRVPGSGSEWLDEMIIKSKRDEFAGMALQGIVISIPSGDRPYALAPFAKDAYFLADAMLKEREMKLEFIPRSDCRHEQYVKNDRCYLCNTPAWECEEDFKDIIHENEMRRLKEMCDLKKLLIGRLNK